MKIVFFARRFYPQIGGVEKHVLEISKQLVVRGHQVIIITEAVRNLSSRTVQGDVKDLSSMIRNDRIRIYRIPVGKEDKWKKFRIWKELWRLCHVIQDADVIHCHDVFFWYLPFRFLYPRKPVYTTFHGYERYPINKKAIIIRKISEKLSWGNICIGDFIPKWYGTKPTFVSYGAVNTRIKNKELRIKNEKDSALFFGRLDDQTGVLDYVKAVELVRKKFPKFELLVVGDGEYKNQLAKKIKVLGFQENPEQYFDSYRFAFVSRYLSILEAFAAKRLVFALYDNPVKEDYLRMTPYAKWIIIEPTPEKLAEKVIYYMQHPEEEKKLVQKAYQWVREQTWKNMTNQYVGLWGK